MLGGVLLVLGVDFGGMTLHVTDLYFLLSAACVSANAFIIKAAQEKYHEDADMISYYNNAVVLILFGCSAALTLPAADEAILKECAGKYGLEIRDGRAELEAGSYEFCYETAEPLRKVLNADTPIMEVFGRPEARAFLEKHGIGISLFPDQARHLSVREISRLWAKVEDSVVKLFDEELSKL
jgi:hypothetical protein